MSVRECVCEDVCVFVCVFECVCVRALPSHQQTINVYLPNFLIISKCSPAQAQFTKYSINLAKLSSSYLDILLKLRGITFVPDFSLYKPYNT